MNRQGLRRSIFLVEVFRSLTRGIQADLISSRAGNIARRFSRMVHLRYFGGYAKIFYSPAYYWVLFLPISPPVSVEGIRGAACGRFPTTTPPSNRNETAQLGG